MCIQWESGSSSTGHVVIASISQQWANNQKSVKPVLEGSRKDCIFTRFIFRAYWHLLYNGFQIIFFVITLLSIWGGTMSYWIRVFQENIGKILSALPGSSIFVFFTRNRWVDTCWRNFKCRMAFPPQVRFLYIQRVMVISVLMHGGLHTNCNTAPFFRDTSLCQPFCSSIVSFLVSFVIALYLHNTLNHVIEVVGVIHRDAKVWCTRRCVRHQRYTTSK